MLKAKENSCGNRLFHYLDKTHWFVHYPLLQFLKTDFLGAFLTTK